MKHIVWTRIDDRLVHDQIMTRWIRHTETNEVLIIDDGITEDSFLQMVMRPSVPGEISLEVLSAEDTIGYLNKDEKHEKIIIPVKAPTVLDELSDAGVCLKSINVRGIGAKVGRRPMLKNISVSEEEKEAFRNLLSEGVNVFLRITVTGPKENIARYLQEGNGIPMRIRSSQVAYRR